MDPSGANRRDKFRAGLHVREEQDKLKSQAKRNVVLDRFKFCITYVKEVSCIAYVWKLILVGRGILVGIRI